MSTTVRSEMDEEQSIGCTMLAIEIQPTDEDGERVAYDADWEAECRGRVHIEDDVDDALDFEPAVTNDGGFLLVTLPEWTPAETALVDPGTYQIGLTLTNPSTQKLGEFDLGRITFVRRNSRA